MADPTYPDRGAQKPPAAPKPKPKPKGPDFGAPPPVVQTGGSKQSKFLTWAKKEGYDEKTAADVWYWAQKYGAPIGGGETYAYYWASVLKAESGGRHTDPKTGQLKDSGQAVGIGQIAYSWVGQKIPWRKDGKKFTDNSDPITGIKSYGVNLRFSASLLAGGDGMGGGVATYGYDGAYLKSYNPKDPHRAKAWANIQQTMSSAPQEVQYAPSSGPGPTPAAPGDTSVAPFRDPYITGINKQGKFTTTNDPNRAMLYNGAPVTRSAFLTIKSSLTSHYISYTGERPSNSQISTYITKNWNEYTLDVLLSKGSKFENSPIVKEFRPNLEARLRDVLPNGGKIPDELLRQAIVNHWDSDTLKDKLRHGKDYLKSNEFKGGVATLLNVHDTIMGTPDAKGMVTVKDAALAGWSADQYAAYLRSQPEYSRSPEYQSKAMTILDRLGLITGAQTVLAKGIDPGPGFQHNPNPSGDLPVDPRIKGNPNDINPPLLDLGATLRG